MIGSASSPVCVHGLCLFSSSAVLCCNDHREDETARKREGKKRPRKSFLIIGLAPHSISLKQICLHAFLSISWWNLWLVGFISIQAVSRAFSDGCKKRNIKKEQKIFSCWISFLVFSVPHASSEVICISCGLQIFFIPLLVFFLFFPPSWKGCWRLVLVDRQGSKCGKQRSAQSLAADQSTDSACRSTFCSLSVVSHSQFRELPLSPSCSLSLDRSLAHLFTLLPPPYHPLPPHPCFSLVLCFSLCLRYVHIKTGLG